MVATTLEQMYLYWGVSKRYPLFIPPRSIIRDGDAVMSYHLETFNMKYPGLHNIHSDPPVFEVLNFMSDTSCDQLIRFAMNGRGTQVSKVTGQTNGSSSTIRDSTSWQMHTQSDVTELHNLAQELTGCSLLKMEVAQVVQYKPGEEYTWHLDYLWSTESQGQQGNRVATLLVYLNTPLGTGGETRFRDLDLDVAPVKGKALLFFPSFSNEEPDFRTVHCSAQAKGFKYIAQIFIRARDGSPASYF